MISVLYVDDEPELLYITKTFLEKTREFSVFTAVSVAEGMDILKKQPVDAIVSDYLMPEEDGIRFLQKVREIYGDKPFILFTGRGREEVVIQAINNGADFYLQKGGDITSQYSELAHKIRQAVRRKSAEESLKENEERFRSFVSESTDGFTMIDEKGVVIEWNPAMERLTGISRGKAIGMPFTDHQLKLIVRKDRNPEREGQLKFAIDNALLTGDAPFLNRPMEVIIERNDGGQRIIQQTVFPIPTKKGYCMGSVSRDITEEKAMESAFHESEERYRNIVEDQTELISRFTPGGVHLFANEAYLRYFGKTPDELIGHVFIPAIPPEDREPIGKHFRALTKEHPQGTIEHRIIKPDGTVRWQQWNDRAIFDSSGKLVKYQSVGRDITDRKKVEDALRESEQVYRTIFENTGTAMVMIDEDTMISLANRKFEELSGYSLQEIENKMQWTDFVVSEDLEKMKGYHKGRRNGSGKSPMHYEFRFLDRKGSINHIFLTVGIIPGTRKSVASLLDITERKKLEEALRESEKNYKRILENIQDAFYQSDREGTLLMVSPSGVHMLGYDSAEQMTGKSISHTFYADPSQRENVFSLLNEKGSINNFEIELKRRDGTLIIVETSSHKYYDSSGNWLGVEGLFRDVTELRAARKALEMANKKLGLLSGITRHDILNKITVLEGYIELMKLSVSDPGLLKILDKQKNALAIINEQILFTGQYEELGIKSPVWQNVAAIISSSSSRFDLQDISVRMDVHNIEIFADPLLITAFSNLFDNSLRHGEYVTKIHVWSSETESRLTIFWEDNGTGIEPSAKDKIFERGVGKHTGLGLFLVREILGITGISICETGERGGGARFEIHVPKEAFRVLSTSL